MELARVMANHTSVATMMFAAVAGLSPYLLRFIHSHSQAGEEQGLFGSAFMAATLKNASADVQGMLNVKLIPYCVLRI